MFINLKSNLTNVLSQQLRLIQFKDLMETLRHLSFWFKHFEIINVKIYLWE